MLEYNLKEMKLLATGGEANIYEVDKDKILRVIYKEESKADNVEEIIYPVLEKNKIYVPHIYEYLVIENKKSQLMERIDGDVLVKEWIKHPLSDEKQTYEFSKMHYNILQIKCNDSIPSLNDLINYFVNNVKIDLDENLVSKIMTVFNGLPIKNNLCHGDFHPGNILVSKDKKVIIDWSGVHTGNPISDVAHTYLLMSNVPQIPGQSRIQYFVMRKFGLKRANRYRNMMEELLHFDDKEFDKWLVVMSLLRIYCGLPSEKEERIKFIMEWSKR